MDAGTGASVFYLADTNENSLVVDHDFKQDSYKFKVRAINQCGEGPFSTELTLFGEG